MRHLFNDIAHLHRSVFAAIERGAEGWFLGLAARFVFAAVLWIYFLNSARTKVGDGLAGFFTLTPGAYYQIALPAVEAAGGDVEQVAFLPWGLIVTMGTYAEFVLPLLIVIGLFTRIAALGMIAFIAVQTLVDITVHQIGAEAIGSLFDRFPDAAIADQRLLWLFVLIVIVLKGPGWISLDGVLAAGHREPAGRLRPSA
ncbi:DoxX family protein [Pseudohoeflea coraliihabitans]|uniref:DoxX family protein n=1 Tax=Pseudohoeflea coraliihabitans TaxID=2860393 RepID=A0ABS6WK76_9HYPH|nr:DoxX family protein [Pseudohoeflea sp. DP4N28-3]MBW3096347.1 DoxX family protein [Pseudohoeflea sp. DP4N28-3]